MQSSGTNIESAAYEALLSLSCAACAMERVIEDLPNEESDETRILAGAFVIVTEARDKLKAAFDTHGTTEAA